MASLADMMKQFGNMQDMMKNMKEKLSEIVVIGEAGAGLVAIKMDANFMVLEVKVDPSLKEDSIEVLEDLTAAAMRDAVIRINEQREEKLKSLASGLGVPAEFSSLFNS